MKGYSKYMVKNGAYKILTIFIAIVILIEISACGKQEMNIDKDTESDADSMDEVIKADVKQEIIVDSNTYVLDWHDEFDENALDSKKWLPQYLPHNTNSLEGCTTNYSMKNGILKLIIDENAVDYYTGDRNRTDGGFMASSIQTYEKTGLHMKTNKTTVAPYTGYVTQYGYFELRCKMPSCDGGGIAAWWFVGTEYDAKDNGLGTKQNGEIDVFETYFKSANVFQPKVHVWDDPDLTEWRDEVVLQGEPSDYTEDWHTYAMNWTPEYLAFYVDGEEVSRTNQSPQYDMAMFLSLYTSRNPKYWGGGAANNVYPKKWEIDYIRVYKDENGYPNGVTKPKDRYCTGLELIEATVYREEGNPAETLQIKDIARVATLETTGEHANELKFINSPDYNALNGTCSVDNPNLPAEYSFVWKKSQDVYYVNLYSYFANGQGPTVIEIQVKKEGNTEWTKAGEYEIDWKMYTEAVEYAKLPVAGGENITALKIIVKDANLTWKHYVIQKIHIY